MNSSQLVCNRCEAELVQISEEVVKSNYLSPMTVIKYTCSNITCQQEADKKLSDSTKHRAEIEKAKQLRADQRASEKMAIKLAKV